MRVSATKTPLRWRRSMRCSRSNCAWIRSTVAGVAPHCTRICVNDGKRSPGFNSPLRIWRANFSASVKYFGREAVFMAERKLSRDRWSHYTRIFPILNVFEDFFARFLRDECHRDVLLAHGVPRARRAKFIRVTIGRRRQSVRPGSGAAETALGCAAFWKCTGKAAWVVIIQPFLRRCNPGILCHGFELFRCNGHRRGPGVLPEYFRLAHGANNTHIGPAGKLSSVLVLVKAPEFSSHAKISTERASRFADSSHWPVG